MARHQPTLAEMSLRRQVSAANRQAFRGWWDGGVPKAVYWILGLCIVAIVAGVVAWKYFM